MEPTLFRLGIDGGGTRCRARLCDAEGRVLADAEGGAANVYLDFDGALATVLDVVAHVFALARLDDDAVGRTRAGFGLAGVSSPAVAARVEAALPGFSGSVVDHDGVIACLGAHAGGDGGIVIAGTGSAAVLVAGKQTVSIGGRGFLLGDEGSGAWIGREVWRRALRMVDGLEPPTPFGDALLDAFGRDPAAVIAWGRHAPSHAFAASAPRAFAAAASGDPMGQAVIGQAAGAIAELIQALADRAAPRIAIVGGMAGAITPYLPVKTAAMLSQPLGDALQGALLLAERAPR